MRRMFLALIGLVALALLALGVPYAHARAARPVVALELDDAGTLIDAELVPELGRELAEYQVFVDRVGMPAPPDAVRVRVVADEGTLIITALWPDGRSLRREIARPEFGPDAVATTRYVVGTMLRSEDDDALPELRRAAPAVAAGPRLSLGLGGGASLGADSLPTVAARLGVRWARVGIGVVGTFMSGETVEPQLASTANRTDTFPPLRDARVTLGADYWLVGAPGSRGALAAGAFAGAMHERRFSGPALSPSDVTTPAPSDAWHLVAGAALAGQLRLGDGAFALEGRVETWSSGDTTAVDALALVTWGMP